MNKKQFMEMARGAVWKRDGNSYCCGEEIKIEIYDRSVTYVSARFTGNLEFKPEELKELLSIAKKSARKNQFKEFGRRMEQQAKQREPFSRPTGEHEHA